MSREKYYKRIAKELFELLMNSPMCQMGADIQCIRDEYSNPNDGCRVCLARYCDIELNKELEVK